jgi:adenylate cyclase
LLVSAPESTSRSSAWFASFTAVFAVALGLSTCWMLGRLVTRPIDALRASAREVAAGNLETSVELVRSDEFGPLIDDFNNMVAGLRAKQVIQEAFGRHVGQEAVQRILEQDPNLRGASREITVLFADVRNFTARCSVLSAEDVVRLLNLLFTEMVTVIEQQHGGMVNKFLGDGLMALFGAGEPRDDHADAAVGAAREMLERLQEVNRRVVELGFEPLALGIGIHTGHAVVGSIGSIGRSDYTAIGNTVNVASRVESLTKVLGAPILLTEQSLAATLHKPPVKTFPPQEVKGKSQPLVVFGLQGCPNQ